MNSGDMAPFAWGVLSSLVAACIVGIVIRARYLIRRRTILIPPVDIRSRKLVGPVALAGVKPRFMILILSGIYEPKIPGAASDDERRLIKDTFQRQLDEGDFVGLQLSPETESAGHAVRAIQTFPSLERAYLITTATSYRSALAIQKYVKDGLRRGCKVIADPKYRLELADDAQVTIDAHQCTRQILHALLDEGIYHPHRSQTIVDVTGGTRSMQVGVLLACLGSEQDVLLIGAPYDEQGKPRRTEAYPLLIHFAPSIPVRDE
jgi:hypothetical protein